MEWFGDDCNSKPEMTYESIVKGVLGRPFKYAVPINNDGEIPFPRHFRQCKLIFLEDLLQYSQLLEDLLQYSQLLEDLLQYSQLLEDLLQYSQPRRSPYNI